MGGTDQPEAPRCPACGASDPAPILYGYPAMTDELRAAVERGDVVLGGCAVGRARWECRACGLRWPTGSWRRPVPPRRPTARP